MRILLVATLLPLALSAHVGSPDVFFEGKAGPYPVFVTVRPPMVVPGVAAVELRTGADDVERVEMVPMPMVGEGAKHPPKPDVAVRHPTGTRFYTGQLWLMSHGSWQVKIKVIGKRGEAALAIPVPSVALSTTPITPVLGAVLWFLLAILSIGIVGIVSAAVSQAHLRPSDVLEARDRRAGLMATIIASAVVLSILTLGAWWWGLEEQSFDRRLYRPLEMTASTSPNGALMVQLKDPGWILPKRLDDLVPDHGHPMHLFLLRWPDLQWVAHLHPKAKGSGMFETVPPALTAGTYRLYADIAHSNGLAETASTEVVLPALAGAPLLDADDSFAALPAAHGIRVIWVDRADPVPVRTPRLFSFKVETADGKPVSNIERYMGMAAHAAFVSRDGSVFAHVHPYGSVAMPALMLAGTPHAMSGPVPEVITFPYGVPKAGSYRLFVQVKHAGKGETAAFDFNAQ